MALQVKFLADSDCMYSRRFSEAEEKERPPRQVSYLQSSQDEGRRTNTLGRFLNSRSPEREKHLCMIIIAISILLKSDNSSGKESQASEVPNGTGRRGRMEKI